MSIVHGSVVLGCAVVRRQCSADGEENGGKVRGWRVEMALKFTKG